ncbi:MAG: hypothetical protein WDN04_22440 [Rhodospirillales bacterium]
MIGVFADITIKPDPGLGGYGSSLNEPHLVGMEEELGWLKPPTWPAAFPPIDQALAKTGAALFLGKHCDSCHIVPAIPASLTEPYKVTLKKFHSDNPKDAPDQHRHVDDLQRGARPGRDRPDAGHQGQYRYRHAIRRQGIQRGHGGELGRGRAAG